jgi:hypothetical protein
MQPGREALRHDAASLYHFVDSICAGCDERCEFPAYLDPSLRFFKYVRELGDATKEYLDDFANHAPKDPRLYKVYRDKLYLLSSSWTALHKYIRPAVDADTLNIPSPLIDFLMRRFRSIPGFDTAAFTVFHLQQLNYLQIRASFVRSVAKKLQSLIPGAPEFPPGLGMIGIPYSQSDSVYLNSLIPHEMGHFAFQERQKFKELSPEIEKCLRSVLGASFNKMNPEYKAWCSDRLASWAEEIFCDLFAVWLVGPCYTLAYIELFGVTAILDPGIASGCALTQDVCEFSTSHPADLFRLKQHVTLLQRLGYEKKGVKFSWWAEVSSIDSHYIEVLKAAEATSEKDFLSSSDQSWHPHYNETREAFFLIIPIVAGMVTDVMHGLNSGLRGFRKFHASVEEYLRNGIVPSTVLLGSHLCNPDPVTILNASYKFYLESLDSLMEGIADQDPSKTRDRNRWIKRLELWTIKAMEDHKLLSGQRKE